MAYRSLILALCTCLAFMFQACNTTTIDPNVRSWDIGTAKNGTKPDLLIRCSSPKMIESRLGAPSSKRKTILDERECVVWTYNREISRGTERHIVFAKTMGSDTKAPSTPKEVVQKHLITQILNIYFENDELVWVSMQESNPGSFHSKALQ